VPKGSLRDVAQAARRAAALIDQGKSHDEIIKWFTTEYGSEEMLGAPIDTGFSRLAWLFPYLVALPAPFAIGLTAAKGPAKRTCRPRLPPQWMPPSKTVSTMSSATSTDTPTDGRASAATPTTPCSPGSSSCWRRWDRDGGHLLRARTRAEHRSSFSAC